MDDIIFIFRFYVMNLLSYQMLDLNKKGLNFNV